MMEKFYQFFMSVIMTALLSFSFASCDSDDDESFSQANLVGVWDLVHEEGWEIYEGENET